ncbi:hypothetical protein AK830_g3410 [Neonectria ditissima]|uniref:HotDog ACOT-type domain-containing protein n=1 Tax=Neonectria ditissima TaxID=78410 RepID=A0A0P7BQK0_9HYPO|nr:hypothetical protein AK830_g3410 [Neonectria ditissima]
MSNSPNVFSPDCLIDADKAKEYWGAVNSDVDGMLGGIPALMPSVSRVDLQGSRTFLARLGFGTKTGRKTVSRVLEGGAGIGRITEGLLLRMAEQVDVIEPVVKFTDELQGKPGVGEIFNVGLEAWFPTEGVVYDLIWIQWCACYLSDELLVQFLERCKTVLNPEGGVMVVKENLSTWGYDKFDEVDNSVTREDGKFRQLFKEARLRLIRTDEQMGFPQNETLRLLPVRMATPVYIFWSAVQVSSLTIVTPPTTTQFQRDAVLLPEAPSASGPHASPRRAKICVTYLVHVPTQQLTTMSRNRDARSVTASLHRLTTQWSPATVRTRGRNGFHTTASLQTDGVFRGLADTRLPMPWIEAFRLQQQGKAAHRPEEMPKERDLTPKKMSDSYHRVVLPLGQDPWLSDTYINSSGHIRLGTLFMDLDALSGIIVYKHTGTGVTTVTAALDRITIAHPLTEICDLEYSGQVTYASGRSSMEITCKVAKARAEGEPSKPEDVLLTCTFTMVALDPDSRKPVNVPKLVYTTPEEEKIFRAGEAKSLSKKETLKASLLQTEPNDPESALIHRIWLRQLAYHDPNNSLRQPRNVVSMAKTQLSTAAIMQPQYRNRHQTMIFGGFHLKQTFELAFCCAASFAHARPTFISADPCTFRNPVPVGSVLYLTATVAYTDPPLLEEDGTEPSHADPKEPMTRVHVRVDSKVRDVEHGVAKSTGQFNYTFSVPKDLKVLPHTYEEYMIYIDARRRVMVGDSQRKQESIASVDKKPTPPEGVNLIG